MHEPEQMVQAMIGLAGMLRSGLSNVRYAYMPIPPRADRALQFAQRARRAARAVARHDLRAGADRVLDPRLRARAA